MAEAVLDPEPTTPRERVQVVNPADGGYFYWLGKLYGFAACVIVALVVITGVSIYGYFVRRVPATPDLAQAAMFAPSVTRIVAGDGSLLGEFSDEWREVVPYDRMPETLVHAVLAAEDHRFFEHTGVDAKGIARAAWRNVTSGEFAQGGSTITQQVAKHFLGNEKTLARKVKEVILARRLEARYSKPELLSFYLNIIFLGSGAYGVQAAAHRYFGKDLAQLDVSQLAMIAGLAQAPSRDSPLTNPVNAKRRRDSILDKMTRYGYLSAADAEKWKATSLELAPATDTFLSTSPYFAEHVRRSLIADPKYGKDGLMRRGLRVETTVLPWVDGAAYENVDFGTRKQDMRQGWRGPEAHLEGDAQKTFLERAEKKYGLGTKLAEGGHYLALVEKVEQGGATVRVVDTIYHLPLANMDWASKWSKENDVNDQKIGSARDALRAGDVIWVTPARHTLRKYADWELDDKQNARWRPAGEVAAKADEVALLQQPRVQTSIFTFDHQTGYVLAMVGGQDYARSEFNRVTQSCRQPGSTYKPIYYSAALDQGYGFDTVLNDIPHAEVDPITGEVWVPENLHGTMENQVTLEYALVFSKNVPSVDLFKRVGADNVEKWARRLGFTSPIIADRALALGASCVYAHELARAFAIFARNGKWLDLVYVRRVLDRDGNVLEDRSVYYDPMLTPSARLDRLGATAGARPRQVIPERTAFLTAKLLRQMVREGYNGNLRQTGVTSAGKTGTSSATMDLWFVAFTSRWLTTTWIGDDLRERQLGRQDAAFMTAVPMWARYMYQVTEGQKLDEIPWQVPAGVKPNDRGDNKGRGGAEDQVEGIPGSGGDGAAVKPKGIGDGTNG
jgi:penicillin-binding protein 1A